MWIPEHRKGEPVPQWIEDMSHDMRCFSVAWEKAASENQKEGLISMRTITNSSGTFWVEDDGTLQYFECAPDNYGNYKPEYADVDDYDPERHLIRLDIPEGITVLSTTACDIIGSIA